MPSLSIAICAHVARKQQAQDLSRQLLCPIALDEGDRGAVVNHDMALRLAAMVPADWVIVMEDDALPIPDFRQQAAAALDTCPAPFASLYYGYLGSPDGDIGAQLTEGDPNWFMRQGLSSAVCVAIRYEKVGSVLNQVRQITEELPADHRWAEAFNALGHRWVPHVNPSLVDHADEGSLIAGNTEGFPRRAYRVGGRGQWTGSTL